MNRGVRKRRWALALVPVLAAALWALPFSASAATTPGGATGCDQTSYGRVDVGTSVTDITARGQVTCQMPVPGHTVAPGQGSPPQLQGPPPPDGSPCEMRALQPVTLTVTGTDIEANWSDPAGNKAWDGWDDTQYVSIYQPGFMHLYAHESGTYDVLVSYDYKGTYKNGRCQGSNWVEVESPTSDTPCPERGDSHYIPQGSCAIGQQHLPTPVIDPTTQPPGLVVTTVDGLINQQYDNGQVHSSPNNQGAVQGLVNVPTRFWVEGLPADTDRRFEIVSPGPPDAGGRRIVYQYVIEITLNGIDWKFGDGQGGSSQGPGSAATPAVEHPYDTISERGCTRGACGTNGGRTAYHVTATAHYGVTATVVWNDGATGHDEPVPGLNRTYDVPIGAEDLFVGQLEGIPATS